MLAVKKKPPPRIAPTPCAFTQAACIAVAPAYHALLLDAYAASLLPPSIPEAAVLGGGGAASQVVPLAALPLQAVPDDGYLLVNVGYHLMAAGRHSQVGRMGGCGGGGMH